MWHTKNNFFKKKRENPWHRMHIAGTDRGQNSEEPLQSLWVKVEEDEEEECHWTKEIIPKTYQSSSSDQVTYLTICQRHSLSSTVILRSRETMKKKTGSSTSVFQFSCNRVFCLFLFFIWVIGAQVCCFTPHVSLGNFIVLKKIKL